LLTVSNDTWFGESIGPHQHLEMARMRAVENGRWLLRATNNGLTAIVDPKGVLRARLPQFEEGVLRGSYETMAGRTPYNRFGDWPLEILLVTLAAVLLGLRLREE
jgi:apolipoprotein N-acyltransferase